MHRHTAARRNSRLFIVTRVDVMTSRDKMLKGPWDVHTVGEPSLEYTKTVWIGHGGQKPVENGCWAHTNLLVVDRKFI